MAIYKSPLDQADAILRQARKDTLNKRINYKGNNENYVTGGSHALDNQAFLDSNDYVKGMTTPGNGWDNNPEVHELYDRYTNPEHNRRAGKAPYDSGLKYIHGYTPSTRRGRRLESIYFNKGASNLLNNSNNDNPFERNEFEKLINKYERIK